MKKDRSVYVVCSIMQNEFIIFSSRRKAEKWTENYCKEIFDKSNKEDLYITKRILF